MTRNVILAGLCWLACAAGSLAQTTGLLSGQVTDPSGAVVPQATITVTAVSGQTNKTVTNWRGVYEFAGLAAGRYTIQVRAAGFARFLQQLTISAGQESRFNVALQIKHKEEIVVHAESNGVDVNSNQASSVVIKGKDLRTLSEHPGEFKAQLEALAGGRRGQIYVDGFSGAELPPASEAREVRINENPFSAEYDQPGSQRVEVFTNSGTDQFHGELSFGLNSSALDSRNPFLSQQPAYNSKTYRASLGGPIRKHASFLVFAEHFNLDDWSVVNARVLDPNLNEVPFKQAISNPSNETDIGPRVDVQLTPKNKLTVRYQRANVQISNAGIGEITLPSQAYRQGSTEDTAQIIDTHAVSPNTVNETRFQYVRHRNSQEPSNAAPTISVLGAFAGGGSPLGIAAKRQDSYEVQNNTSQLRGRHLVKFGGRLRAAQVADKSTANFNGTFVFDSLDAYRMTELGLQRGWSGAQIRAAGGGASQFSVTTGQPNAGVSLLDAGLYAQDDWRLRDHLTLSYGLRFETQTGIHDHADVAPRAALAWGVGHNKNGSPATVLHAGFGVFYERVTQDILLQAERLNGSNQKEFIVASPPFFPAFPPVSTFSGAQVPPTVYQIASNLRAPYVMQFAVTLERQLSRASTFSVTYLRSRGVHQLLSRNINAPLPATNDPANPASGMRPFEQFGNIYQYQSEGVFKQNQLTTNFNVRAGSKLSLFGRYTLGYANSNTAGAFSFPANQYDLRADYGRAAYDVRHEFFLAGTIDLPYAISFAPFLMANSGPPFNITLGEDLNGDSLFNDRPAFATDLSRASVARTPWGTFDTLPLPGQAIIPPNYGSGPGQFTVNLTASKAFQLGKSARAGSESGGREPETAEQEGDHAHAESRTVTFSVTASNLLNHVNLGLPVSNLSSPLFGTSPGIASAPFGYGVANRRIEAGIRLEF